MRNHLVVVGVFCAAAGVVAISRGALEGSPATTSAAATPAPVEPNDNRHAAGVTQGGVLTVRLKARLGAWRPDLGVDTSVTVQTFAEESGAPRIPGPLLRATEGTEIVVSVRNSLDSVLVVHGLRAGTTENDTVRLAPGAVREVRFRAGAPGTYMYWGVTTRSSLDDRPWRDAPLTGAIVIDPRGAPPDSAERIFVLTLIDIYPDDTARNKTKEDVWEITINGRSWPHTERLEYPVGRPVRWRWINGTYIPHPIHLHGFHFRVTGKSEEARYRFYPRAAQPMAVTEFIRPGESFAMEWTPTRAGSWLAHCHMIPHITPFPERPESTHMHDLKNVAQHPLSAMSGLVLGITTIEAMRSPSVTLAASPQRLRLLAQQKTAEGEKAAPHSFVLQRGAEPRSDSVEVPGAPILLTRGETTEITVVNRLTRPTTVHWHGMELQSVYDGVAGWSRSGSSVAPLIAPGDSFVVSFTPPRAGTYIYHTHIDEGPQLSSGMYGPMLVLEPGTRFDPSRDLVFMIGGAIVNDSVVTTLNGRRDQAPLTLARGTKYRLRFVNIDVAEFATIALLADTVPLRWRAIAKDGADLPPSLRVLGAARLAQIGVGETYDFELVPDRVADAVLEVRLSEGVTLKQVIRVR